MSTPEVAVPFPPRRLGLAGPLVLAGFAGSIFAAHLAGKALSAGGARLGLGTPPIVGRFEPRLGPGLIVPITLAALVIWRGDRLASTLPWRRLLTAVFAAALAWAAALAASAGTGALTAPLANPLDLYASLPRVGAGFLSNFVANLDGFPIHVQGHPPGLLLLLSAMRSMGLASPGWVAWLYIAAGAAAVPAALVAARSVAGERLARAAAPWLVVAPCALWIATSADALYAGVAAWAIALMLLDRPVLQLAGGLLFGIALSMTYGALPLAIVPAAVWLSRRRLRPLILAGLGAATILAAFAAAGFWWLDGLAATRERYYEGLGGLRPYGYFVFANLAALALACGPAAIRGLAEMKVRGIWLLTGAALVAVAVADLSGLSKGEVERIWLMFMPWILLAAGSIGRNRRWWLAASAATAIAVQALVVTPW